MDVKVCRGCGESKPIGSFYHYKGKPVSHCTKCRSASTQRWRERNRQRHRDYQKEYRRKNPEQFKLWSAKHVERNKVLGRKRTLARDGLTPEGFDALFVSQGNKCAICETTIPGGHGWHVDHDHATEKVRGILCSRCNPPLTEHVLAHWAQFDECVRHAQ